MKRVIFIILLSFSINMYGQENEQLIIDCIEMNTKSVGLDFNLEISKIKNDLIKNNIIKHEFSSIRMKFKEIKRYGEIKQTREYENVLFEQVGLKTINYCLNLHHYGKNANTNASALLMYNELSKYSIENFSNADFKTLTRNTASIIDKYLKEKYENSRLWNLISISYLYLLTSTQEMKDIIEIPELNYSLQDTSNLVKLLVNGNNEIVFKGNIIKITEICENIEPYLEQGKGIGLNNERQTKYKTYLDVYNSIKECYNKLREKKSKELYSLPFEELNTKEKKIIQQLVPIRIIELETK